ncbi:hypothetical protein ASF87_12995 [Microbacterium sp. Leaf161]|uniref:hypothetical protein n=1 Tax=Microbacterium sp. Leaf161 TaxID=1736281 RepID=UPI0006FE0EAA|nr:hypothetical protein [Microbacterium sp. Leaf161]KQR45178.1 hypothetical protein ASF87_12995 [Microbacterium sp. Leaf161]
MPHYEIRVAAPATEILVATVPEMLVISVSDGSLLVGELRDQSDLQSLLNRVSDLGIEVVEYRKGS